MNGHPSPHCCQQTGLFYAAEKVTPLADLDSSPDLKEMQQSSRPLAHQRPSLSAASSSLPARQTHARNSSHSLLTGSLNPNHRVTRRKSVTNQTPNVAALTAAIADTDPATAIPIANASGRRNTMSKAVAAKLSVAASLPSPPASLPLQRAFADAKMNHDSAIDDESNMSGDDVDGSVDGNRLRRASDGQPLTKDGKKSNRVEVRCETCGKGYKHSSCLTKHLSVFLVPGYRTAACLSMLLPA